MTTDPEALNQQFRAVYAEAREVWHGVLGSHAHPVLVKLDDDLILYADGRREVYRICSRRYAWLKTLAHLPLAIALSARHEQRMTQRLEVLQQACAQARQEVQTWDDQALRENNQQLLDASLAFLRTWAHQTGPQRACLAAYTRDIEPLLTHNLQAAAEDELGCLHRTVCQLRATVLCDTWPRVVVVICGSHQARYREPVKRYFQTLFAESEQTGAVGERRVIYGEGIAEEAHALQLLASQQLDRELGTLFLGNPLALQQDVLGKAAEAVIKRLFATP